MTVSLHAGIGALLTATVLCGQAPEPDPAARRAAASNDVAFALQRALRDPTANLVFSPTSIAGAFAVVHGCLEGETRAEVARALRFDVHGEAFADAQRALTALLAAEGGPLTSASRMWLAEGAAYRRETLARLGREFGTAPETVDFRDAEAARGRINAWTAEATRTRIPEILPTGVLDASVRFVIVDAVHFKDRWASKFDPALTKPRPFAVAADDGKPVGDATAVPMMSARIPARLGADADGSYLELDYASGAYAFFVALPAGGNLRALEDRLTSTTFAAKRAAMKPIDKASVRIPRFRADADLKLHRRGLRELGMSKVFASSTDWRPLIDDALAISYVGHKAVVQVDEEGTEAAAATVAVGKRGGAPKEDFVADRPFLYAVVHKATGAVVFLGRCLRPE
ncbi:MAG TPA: serpin family protein [Planctomycetota bacterium]|nr:serpin family protein [Planctomycetota bacterium]